MQQLLKFSFTSVLYTVSHHWRNLLMVQIRLQDLFGDAIAWGLWISCSPAAWLKAMQFILQQEQLLSSAPLTLKWTSLWSNSGQDARLAWECLYDDFHPCCKLFFLPLHFIFLLIPAKSSSVHWLCLLSGRISELRENPNDITHNWTEYVQITLQTVLQEQLYYILICTDPVYVKKSKTFQF